jgi:hypothetical protein
MSGQGESDGPPVVERLTLTPTAAAPEGAELVLELLPVDEAGNWAMSGNATGLTPLAEGGYYEVWMTVAGELAVSCGRFIVDSAGAARNVWLNAPYDFAGYDLWVVVAVRPGEPPSGWLLEGPVTESL